MGVVSECPACGFKSSEMRCPRCNALKVVGCSGSCTLCGEKKCPDTAKKAEALERQGERKR